MNIRKEEELPRPEKASTDARVAASVAAEPTPGPIVVGLGASAGGLEAIQEFFNNMGGDPGAAFVVVQHLSPDFKSLMDEILRRHTGMSVVKVQDRIALQPNCVYLPPPRSNIVVDSGYLRLEQQGDVGSVPRPIDEFMRSLARERGEGAIAVILSGTGTDGVRGVREVKDAGGTVLAQEPGSARFDGMPSAAIATGCTDFIMPPGELAESVTALLEHPFLRQAVEGFEADPPDKEPYEAILETLETRLDCDLTAYEPGTLVRRIERRMSLHHLNDPTAYLSLLRQDDEESARLARDCLINVTHFFRDPSAFQSLRLHLVRRLMETREAKGPFRVWVAGCASGEEAYSIAALLQKTSDESGVRREFKVFATDIADSVLEAASAGLYPSSIADELPRAHLELLGTIPKDGYLRVAPALHNRIVFAKHDVLRDPPFPRADLVTCRNLLIYFKQEAQRAALERFLFSLNPGGLLFLGASESVDPIGDEFDVVDATSRIYRKKPGARRMIHFRYSPANVRLRNESSSSDDDITPLQDSAIVRGVEGLVSTFARAGVIVNDAGRVLYSFGDPSGWLNVPRGRISNIPADNGQPGLDVLLLRSQVDDAPSAAVSSLEDGDIDAAIRQQIDSLERDLESTRENLQTTIEELETANEELQATNEELQSTNEELHSVNEELYTVNTEHEQKIAELTEVTGDLEHLLNTTAIGTVFLDQGLCVRRFTPSAKVAIPLREQDRGRSITELTSFLVDADLGELAGSVVKSGTPIEQQVSTTHDVPIHLRIHPYVGGGGQITGAVITFVDLSAIERAQRATLEQAKILRSIEETSRDLAPTGRRAGSAIACTASSRRATTASSSGRPRT